MKVKSVWVKILLITVCILGLYLLIDGLDLAGLLEKERLRVAVSSFGMFSYVIFGLVYMGASLILFPSVTLSVAAGYIFGKVAGTMVVVVSATLVASIAFYIARYFSEWVYASVKRKSVLALVKRIDNHVESKGFQTFLLLRMLFLPYMYVSYAAGLVRKAKFRDFFWATLLTNIVGSFIFVYLGDGLGKGWKALILPGILVVLIFLVPVVVRLVRRKV